jgi:hypothetical protein
LGGGWAVQGGINRAGPPIIIESSDEKSERRLDNLIT